MKEIKRGNTVRYIDFDGRGGKGIFKSKVESSGNFIVKPLKRHYHIPVKSVELIEDAISAKEKAEELLSKFEPKCKVTQFVNQDSSEYILPKMKKDCVIILVDEILNSQNVSLDKDSHSYWKEVLKCLEEM